MCYAAIVCFGLCPCQHNGTYTRNVYPATPTKKPAQILRFAESKNEPLSRKILGKAARNALGKGTGPSNLPKSILASFCHASKNGRKKARKSLKLLGFSQRHLFWCNLMAKNRNFDRNPSRGCNYGLEGVHFDFWGVQYILLAIKIYLPPTLQR